MRRIALFITLVVLLGSMSVPAAHAAATGAFWVRCTWSHTLKDDPIVYPRQPGAAHQHAFMGARDTDAFSTYTSMRAGGTTCALSADTAGYWVPTLVNSDGRVIIPFRLVAYYRGDRGTVPFPPGYQEVVGNSSKADVHVLTGTNDLYWSCSQNAGDSRHLATIPTDCGRYSPNAPIYQRGLVTAVIVFRSATLPRLTLNVKYNVVNGTGFNLSSDAGEGTSRGRSLHADFWNTWKQTALASLVNQCINTLSQCGQAQN